MNLYEILGMTTPPRSVKLNSPRSKLNKTHITDSPNTEKLGSGYYAAVYGHKTRPETVIKVGRTEGSEAYPEDGFLNYLYAISKNDRMASNPYLPRVYKSKIYKPPGDNPLDIQYALEMEKLEPISVLDKQQLEAMAHKMFYDFPIDDSDSSDVVRMNIVHLLDSIIALRDPHKVRKVKDKQLLQAIAIISNIHKRVKGRVAVDVHDGNVMVRRTSVGPQLVITDPLS